MYLHLLKDCFIFFLLCLFTTVAGVPLVVRVLQCEKHGSKVTGTYKGGRVLDGSARLKSRVLVSLQPLAVRSVSARHPPPFLPVSISHEANWGIKIAFVLPLISGIPNPNFIP
jgi:hypothetical protein